MRRARRGVLGEAAKELWFLGERQDLEEMVGNLLDNAGKWASGAVSIAVTREAEPSAPGRALLLFTIEDDGLGLAPQLRAAATQRGRRLTKPARLGTWPLDRDRSRRRYGGSLRLADSPKGGLRAQLRLPGF